MVQGLARCQSRQEILAIESPGYQLYSREDKLPLLSGHQVSRSHLQRPSGGAGEQFPSGMLLRDLALWAQKFTFEQKWPVERRKIFPMVKKKVCAT